MKQIRRRRSSLDSLPSSSRRFRKASRAFPFAYSVNPSLCLLVEPLERRIFTVRASQSRGRLSVILGDLDCRLHR